MLNNCSAISGTRPREGFNHVAGHLRWNPDGPIMKEPVKSIRDGLHRHVTTACGACRMKRCKCDGRKPCSRCSDARGPCIYTDSDRRRRSARRQRLAADECLSRLEQIPNTAGETFSRNRRLNSEVIDHQDSVAWTGTSDLISNLALSDQSRTRNSLNNDADNPGHHRDVQLPSMEAMKGQFRIEPALPKSHIHTGSARNGQPSARKLLPKGQFVTHTSNITEDRNLVNRSKNADWLNQQSMNQGYPVPGYARTFGNLPFSSSISANGYSRDVQARQALNFASDQHLVLPLVEMDDSPLGRALTDFQKLVKDLTTGGTPLAEIASRGLTDATLFFRDRLASDPVTVSTWTAEMLKAFRGTFSDQLHLACAVCVVNLLRWILEPTPENYANMPSIIRPTKLQTLKPHPAWVDLMMFPSFRDALVDSLRDWVGSCMKAEWELSWTEPLEGLLLRRLGSQNVFISPDFAEYVSNPEHWRLRKSILEDFPEIAGSEMNIVYQ